MKKEYVTQLNFEFEGQPRVAYRVANTRISLDSVVINWLNGESAESIVQNFDTLSLESVYGTIAFYLANRALMDDYLRQNEVAFDQLRERLREKNYLLYQKLNAYQEQPLAQAA